MCRPDLLVPPELAELIPHPLYVRAGPPQDLRRHVVAGDDAREQVVGADRRRLGRAGRGLTRPHHGLLGLSTEHLEDAPGALALLLHEVPEHRERVHPAGAGPDHAELPSALSAKVRRRLLVPLLPEDPHARRPYPAVLTYHPFKCLL